MACHMGRGSEYNRPGCGISLLGGGHQQPQHRAIRIYTELRKQTLGEHKQNHVHTRTQEKGAVTTKETDPELPVSVQGSLVEAWVSVGGTAAGWGVTEYSSVCRDHLKEFTIVFISSTIVWSQVKQQGENTAPSINIKLD